MWLRMGLTQRVMALVVLGLLLVLAAFAFVSMWVLRESVQRSLQERLLLAQVAAESIDHYNRSVLAQIQEVSGSRSIVLADRDREQENRMLEGLQSRLSAGELFLLDQKGTVLSIQPSKKDAVGVNLSNNRYVESAYFTGQPRISWITPSLIDGSPVVVYLVPILGPDGRVAGAIGAGIDLTQPNISGYIEAIKLGRTGYAQVVDEKGEVLASTQPEHIFGKSDHGDRFVTLIQDKEAVVRTCHNCHDSGEGASRRRDVMAFAPLSTASWGVAVRQAEEEALRPAQTLRLGVLGVGTTSLLLALGFTAILMRSLLSPIRRLTEAARRIAAGDLSGPIEAKGEDEIGVLARSFETMRAKLEISRQQAEALYELGVEISALMNVDRVLDSVVGKARELLGADVAILSLLDESTGKIHIRATSGVRVEAFNEMTLNPPQGFAGKVVELGRVVTVLDYMDDSTISHDDQMDSLVEQEGLKSHAGAPLKIADKAIGALAVAHRSLHTFQHEETDLLSRLANQAALAIENARLYEEVRHKEEVRGQLLERLISAQEDERRRLARELHDDSAQALSGLIMQFESIERELPPELAEMKDRLARHRISTVRALEDIRRLIADLRPTALDDLGLLPAIRWYAADRLESQGVEVAVESPKANPRLPAQLETALFRMVQEAINNIAKHAQCSAARIALQVQDSLVRVVIADNGKSFRAAEALRPRHKEAGVGLLGIQERVALFGGTLNIESSPGHGTRITIEIPLAVDRS